MIYSLRAPSSQCVKEVMEGGGLSKSQYLPVSSVFLHGMGSNNPCSKWATPTNSLKCIWGALRALQGPHLAPWGSVEAIACLCQPRCFCAVGNEFSLWIYIRTDQWGQFWALNHLIWGHRTNQKTLIWPQIAFFEAHDFFYRSRLVVCVWKWVHLLKTHQDWPSGSCFSPFLPHLEPQGPQKALICPEIALREALGCLSRLRTFVCGRNWVNLMGMH